jgi:thioredoxin 1
VLDGQKVEKPLIEDKSLSALYDQAVEEYRKTIAANQKELADNVHYLDMTDVAPENILQTILDKYKGKAVLIDLWATWCGPCRKLSPVLEEISADYEGKVKFTKLNIEENKDIAKKYSISGIPCLLIFKDGTPVERMVGLMPKSTIISNIEKHI